MDGRQPLCSVASLTVVVVDAVAEVDRVGMEAKSGRRNVDR